MKTKKRAPKEPKAMFVSEFAQMTAHQALTGWMRGAGSLESCVAEAVQQGILAGAFEQEMITKMGRNAAMVAEKAKKKEFVDKQHPHIMKKGRKK